MIGRGLISLSVVVMTASWVCAAESTYSAEHWLSSRFLKLDARQPAPDLKQLTAVVEREKNSPKALIERGNGYLIRTDPRNALSDFERALILDSNQVPAMVGRSRALFDLGRYPDAIKQLRAASLVAIGPSKTLVLWELADKEHRLHEYAHAEADFRKLTDMHFDKPQMKSLALMQLAQAMIFQKKFREAINACDRANKLDSQNKGLTIKAQANFALGNLQESLKWYTEAINRAEVPTYSANHESSLVELYKQRAVVYTQLYQNKFAEKDLQSMRRAQAEDFEVVPFRTSAKELHSK